jgi:hypothetical protein
MSRRTLILALLVLLALAVYAWISLRQEEQARAGRFEQGDRVFSAARESLESLELGGPDGRRAEFRRGEGGWEAVGAGAEVPADRVPEVLYAWSMVRFLIYVEEEPGDLSPYGLEPPRYRLAATSRDGVRHALTIGSDSTLSTALGTYARVDDIPAVVVLDVAIWSLIEELEVAFGLAEAPAEDDAVLPH